MAQPPAQSPPSTRQPVGILGATGMVGQRFVQLLENHPWFEIAWLAASDRSEGRLYKDAARWKLGTQLPERIANMRVSAAVPEGAPHIIFAALDSDIALEMEPRFAAAGCAVITNSSAFRMAADVPLTIPEVNSGQLALIARQSWRREAGGFIVTNPNCCAVGLVLALAPLEQAFGLEAIFVSTMQAISGAGYPGVASMDILGNVVPYIKNEEEKLEAETLKLLGRMVGGSNDSESQVASYDGSYVQPLDAKITAHCNRVSVEDGHTECVSVKLRRPATAEQILAAWQNFKPLADHRLPSAPEQPIVYLSEPDRPQPRLDLMRGQGMATTIGRLRPCNLLDWKFTLLSHNTIRGAAGAALLNAEMLHQMGELQGFSPDTQPDALKEPAAVVAR